LRSHDQHVIGAGEAALTPPARQLVVAMHAWLGRQTATMLAESSEAR
jgi:hypothetical protein